MTLRVVILLNLGPPFGGFRLAMRPGMLGMNHPEAFAVLERATEAAYGLLAAHLPAEWPKVARAALPATFPRLGTQAGWIDFTATAREEEAGDLIARACLPFRAWPFGGWVVYEGRHRALDGTWTSFTSEELAELW